MKRIVVGTDGTDAAGAAVMWAAQLAAATGADLVVTSAWSPEEDDGEQETEIDRRDARRRLLDEQWTAPGRSVAVPMTTRLLEGTARDELPRLAIDEDADLLVIGASSDTDHPNRLAKDLLHHLHRPLAVIPAAAPPITDGRLVVGVDGSGASEVALRWALDVAPGVRAGVTAVFAHDPLADSYPHPDLDNWSYHGERAVRTEVARAHDEDVGLDFVRPAGKPAEALERVADDLDAAAIVVGTRGRGGLHGLIVGRVATRLVERAARPVIVVPH